MYKIRIRLFFGLLAVLMILFMIPNTLAAEPLQDDQNSEAEVTFITGTGPTQPVFPEDPDTPVEPEDPGVTGSLAIVSVSRLEFSALTISAQLANYLTTTVQPNIQMVDLRGSGNGWTLSATLGEFKNEDSAPSLRGARICFGAVRPTAPGAVLGTTDAPVQAENLALVSGSSAPTTVFTAGKDKGMGLWVMRWYGDEPAFTPTITLEVPAGAATVGKHTATIDWCLADVP